MNRLEELENWVSFAIEIHYLLPVVARGVVENFIEYEYEDQNEFWVIPCVHGEYGDPGIFIDLGHCMPDPPTHPITGEPLIGSFKIEDEDRLSVVMNGEAYVRLVSEVQEWILGIISIVISEDFIEQFRQFHPRDADSTDISLLFDEIVEQLLEFEIHQQQYAESIACVEMFSEVVGG